MELRTQIATTDRVVDKSGLRMCTAMELKIHWVTAWVGMCSQVKSMTAFIMKTLLLHVQVDQIYLLSLSVFLVKFILLFCKFGNICLKRKSTFSEPTEGSVRLSTDAEGVVEVYRYKKWGRICADGFGALDSKVVCRNIGLYGGTVISSTDSVTKQNDDILLWGNAISCDGTEESLLDCSGQWSDNYLGYNYTLCVGGAYVTVMCSENENTTNSDSSDCDSNNDCDANTIMSADNTYENSSAAALNDSINPQLNFVLERAPVRLRGSTPYRGIVELYVENMWTTICDSYWNNNDATVVCKQLGFRGGHALGKDCL